MNDKQRMQAMLAHPQLSDDVLLKNLNRLFYGDLTSIGDAMALGKEVQGQATRGHWFSPKMQLKFVNPTDYYRVKPQTKKALQVGDTVLDEAPITEEPEDGAKVWWWSSKLEAFVNFNYRKTCEYRTILRAGLIFKTKAGAKAHHEAMQKLCRWVEVEA